MVDEVLTTIEKKIYPILDYYPVGEKVIKSLHEISKCICGDRKEVFLLNYDDGDGYVWCFDDYDNPSFERPRYSFHKIRDGIWIPLTNIEDIRHPETIEKSDMIREHLKEAYSNTPVKFAKFEFNNPFYNPSAFLGQCDKKKIEFLLAVEGGEQMARNFEKILEKYI